jgi:hypothetical protein
LFDGNKKWSKRQGKDRDDAHDTESGAKTGTLPLFPLEERQYPLPVEKEMRRETREECQSDPEMDVTPSMAIQSPQRGKATAARRKDITNEDACGCEEYERAERYDIYKGIHLRTLHLGFTALVVLQAAYMT